MKRTHKLFIVSMISAMCASTSFAAIEPGYITPHDDNLLGSNVVYEYNENNQFKVRGKLGYLTDLTLGRNEKLTGIMAGNTEDWKVSSATVDATPHVYLKPIVKNASPTNLIVNTNKRSYRFIIRLDEYYDDVISFSNLTPPVTTNADVQSNTISSTLDTTDIAYAVNYDYKYEKAKNVRRSIIPTKIWDDGVKTYIEVPTTNIRNLPVVYAVDTKGALSLVNSRLQDHQIVIDTVLPRLQLRFKTDSYLTVVNNKEAGIKSVKVKELNQVLNQSTDILPSQPSNTPAPVQEARPDTVVDIAGLVGGDIPPQPRVVITRDSYHQPVQQDIRVATNHNSSIQWVPLKERIAKLQQERGIK